MLPGRPPSPSVLARTLTFLAVVVAGACGGLIGWAIADLQCTGSCEVPTGVSSLVGALVAAGGTSVICVLAIHAMAEWREQEGRRRPS